MEFVVVFDSDYLPDTFEFTFDDPVEAMSFAIKAKKHSDDGNAYVTIEVREKDDEKEE